jgi:hypothetical protein
MPKQVQHGHFAGIFVSISMVIFINILQAFPWTLSMTFSRHFEATCRHFQGHFFLHFGRKLCQCNASFGTSKSVLNQIKIGQFSYFQIYRNNLICPSKYNMVGFAGIFASIKCDILISIFASTSMAF